MNDSSAGERATRSNVLFVHDTNEFGGIELFMLKLARHCDRARYDVAVMVPGYRDPFRSSPQEFIDLVHRSGIRLLRPPDPGEEPGWSFWNDIRNLYRLLRENKIDLVHVHTPSPHRAIKVTLAAKLARVPLVRSEHLPPSFWRLDSPRVRWGARVVGWLSDRIVPGSRACYREQVELLGRPARKLNELSYGIELQRFDPAHDVRAAKTALGLDPATPLVGKIARLSPEKGYVYLIDAAALVLGEYGPVNFLLVGEGRQRAELEAAVRERGIADRVVFTGFVPDTVPYMQAMDVAVMSSVNEGVSLAMLELLAMGKPMVASTEASFVETVRHEEEALLVPLADSRALADGILRLLRDRGLARRLSAAALRRAKDFDIGTSTERHMSLYEELLG